MKVCLLNHRGEPTLTAATNRGIGGLNTILYNLAGSLSRVSGVDVAVICSQESSGRKLPESGVGVRVIGIDGGCTGGSAASDSSLWSYAEDAGRILQSERPDVVHTSGAEAGYVMSLLRRQGVAVPWVHTNYATLSVRKVEVEGLDPKRVLEDAYAKRELQCLQGCDRVIALSVVDRAEIVRVFGIPEDKVVSISPGVDRDIFHPTLQPPSSPLIVSAGRMSWIKDFPFLLRAFRHCFDKLGMPSIGAKLLIIGGNDAEREELGLPKLASDLGIERYTAFLDGISQHELARHFQKAKVFAGCSLHETFGLLPVEARACGVPFVVRSNGSYLATAMDGFGGFIADNIDEEDMGMKIAMILDLVQSDWENLSKQAVQSIEEFNWSVTAQKHLFIYEQVQT